MIGVYMHRHNDHAACLDVLQQTIVSGFEQLGYRARHWAHLSSIPSAQGVVVLLNAHATPISQFDAIRAGAKKLIIYNTEVPDTGWVTAEYVTMLKRADVVWTYAERDVAYWSGLANKQVQCVRPLWAPIDGGSARPTAEADILFFGSPHPRRSEIMQALVASGVTVTQAFGIYGDKLDRLISSHKAVLNLHYYENAPLEAVRLQHALLRGVRVVSECGAGMDHPAYRTVLFGKSTSEIIAQCRHACRSAEPNYFHRYPIAGEIARALGMRLPGEEP